MRGDGKIHLCAAVWRGEPMIDGAVYIIFGIVCVAVARYWRRIAAGIVEFKKCLKAADDFLIGPPS